MVIKGKDIITDETILGERADEIDPRKEGKLVQEIVLALKTTMREKNLEYLTAPQIGYMKRIFCIRFGNNDYRSFVNPVIYNNIGFTLLRETCCSIPDKTFIRPRFNTIEAMYMTPLGKSESRKIVGRSAQVFSHCVDHLDGLLLPDVGLEIDELFDNATEEERDEVIKAYMESLDVRQKELEKEIEETEELKEMNDAINFITKVQKGEVTFTIGD